MRVEITLEKYKKHYNSYFDNPKVEYEIKEVWEYYHQNIYPYLSIISMYRQENQDKYANDKQIQMALFINRDMWMHCKKTFKGLKSALNGKAVRMDMMVQAQLIKEMMFNPNAKYIEMGLKRWDEGYNPKGDTVEIEMPSTLKVEIKDERKNDEELKEYSKKIE